MGKLLKPLPFLHSPHSGPRHTAPHWKLPWSFRPSRNDGMFLCRPPWAMPAPGNRLPAKMKRSKGLAPHRPSAGFPGRQSPEQIFLAFLFWPATAGLNRAKPNGFWPVLW